MSSTLPRRFHPAAAALGLLLAVHLVLLGLLPLTDFDTWFHLKQGELFVATRSLPAQDPFAFTTAGREWIKYAWAPDVALYLVDRAAGLPGLVLLRLLMLLLIAGILYRVLRTCGTHPVLALLLVFMASLALRSRPYVRPELFSYPLLLATIAVLVRLRDRPPWSAYALLPIQVVWVNVHASFVFGLWLPGLTLLSNLLPGRRAAPGWDQVRLDRPRARHLGLTVALIPGAWLLNPGGGAALLFPFRQNSMARLTAFVEWRGVWYLPTIDPFFWEVLLALGLILFAFLVASLLLARREGKFDPIGWGIVLSMGIYAVLRSRAVPYSTLALLPFLALALARLAHHLPARALTRTLPGFERMGGVACGLVLATSLVMQFLSQKASGPRWERTAGDLPAAAAAFLERRGLDGRVFNAYEFGGYVIWRRWPANQVIIDGRYDGVLFDPALLERYIGAYRSPAALDQLAAANGIEILLLNADPRYWQMPFIGGHPDWARVYWDKVAEVYVRRGGRHQGLIDNREYRLTRPEPDLRYLAAYRKDPALWARAVAELRRAVGDNQENTWAWLGLVQEYRAAGPAALAEYVEALTRLVALLPPDPPTGALQADRAEALLELGRNEEAAAAARAALRLDENLLRARWLQAVAAERRRAWAEARDHLRGLLDRLEPGHAEIATIRQRLEAVERALHGGAAPPR